MAESDAPSSKIPPGPRRPLWRRLLGLPRHLWKACGGLVDALWPELQGRRRKVVQALLLLGAILLSPILLPLAFWATDRPAERLRTHAMKIWHEQSPYESLTFLRSVHERVQAAEREGRFKSLSGFVEVPPIGRLGWHSSKIEVPLMLYNWLYTLEQYEEARTLMASQPTCEPTVVYQVDCLLKLYRKGEAIRLLESNLHLDGRRGVLRKRLDSLTTGGHLRSVS